MSAALLTNALLHALVAFPSGTPTTTHHFYDRGFLAATCLAPQQPLPVRKAALVLLCRLLEEERAQQRLEQERQRPRRRQHQQQHQRHRSTQQQPSTTSNRRLRLAVQGCLLEPALRGPAAAALLQLFRLLPPAEPASAWDALLLRAPQALLPSQWPHAPSTSASYVALYMSAALQQRVRSPTAGAVDDEEEGETCALVAHLLQWLDLTSAALTQGSTDTLSPSYPVALTLLLALVEAGAATDAQRAQLRELCCPQASRSSTTVPDDIRMVSPMPSGQDEEDEAELTEGGVWWPPQLLERWMHAQGTGGVGCQQREQEEQDEEGAAPTPTRSDDVDLRGVVWRLREAVAE